MKGAGSPVEPVDDGLGVGDLALPQPAGGPGGKDDLAWHGLLPGTVTREVCRKFGPTVPPSKYGCSEDEDRR